MKPTAFLLSVIFIVSFGSCRFVGGKRVEGNGNRATVSRSVGEFDGVEVRGGIDVVVTNGAEHTLKIEADQNLMDYIEVNNNGGTIEVSSRDGYNLRSDGGIKVYATAPAFEHISVAGSGDIRSTGTVKGGSKLELQIRGSGDIQLAVDAPAVEAEIAGSGSARLQGTTRSLGVDINGAGDVKAFELLSETANIDIAGSGNAEVFASKQLQVEIKGAGDVAYKGSATVNQKIMGAGNVRKVN